MANKIDYLSELHHKRLKNTSLDFVRKVEAEIDWSLRLIGIVGPRGVGKTTMLLQHIKLQQLQADALYVSLDNLWVADYNLQELADWFSKKGGKYLFLDEVHKYPKWAQVIKNIYDDYPELHIVFTGSSLLDILNARADLSRRAIIYKMQGLSFREFLQLETGIPFDTYSLADILRHHTDIALGITESLRPLKYFGDYLEHGYYPFYRETSTFYHQQVQSIVNMIIEIELPLLRGVDISFASKIKQLLSIIAASAPFTPNTTKISERIGINRLTLLAYLQHLQDANLTFNLFKADKGISALQKPEKILLDNTNLAHAILSDTPDVGALRETFFSNQLRYQHRLHYPESTDFLIDESILMEIGGQHKKRSKVLSETYYFIAADNIEVGHHQTIPLWLFGFLY
jgi:predicted AAA+ superfamily ATPase